MRLFPTALSVLALAGCASREEAPPPVPRIPTPDAAAPATPPPAPGLPLDLPACLRLAEAQSERLGAILQDVRIAEAQRDLIRSGALPNLSANLEYRRQEDVGGSSTQNLPERREARLTLQQPLFQGFRDLYAYRSATLHREGIEKSRDRTLLEVRIAVCEAYGRVLSLESQQEAVASSLALASDRRAELDARLKVGLARRTELLFAEAQVARGEAQQTQLEGDCADARAFLSFLIAAPVQGPLAPFPGMDLPSLDPQALTARALENRQDLAALQREEQASREAVQAEKAGHWFAVDFTGNFYGKREGASQDVDWDAALLGRLPLFEGGRTAAKVRLAEAAQDKATLALREKRRGIAREVQEAFSAFQAAKAVLASLERETRAAQETEELLQEEVRQGIAPQSEHLTAQDTLMASRVALARQRIQERLAALSLWTVLGEFPLRSPEMKEKTP